MRSALVWGLAIGAATGCVPRAKVVALEGMYDAAIQARDGANASRDAALDRLAELQADHRARLDRVASVRAMLQGIADRGVAEARVDDREVALLLPTDGLFEPGEANLTEAGRKALRELAAALKESEARFLVEGHTDAEPLRSKEFPTHWHLGADRAIQVVLVLIEAGLPAERLSAASRGREAPLVGDDTPEGRALDRRIALVWRPAL